MIGGIVNLGMSAEAFILVLGAFFAVIGFVIFMQGAIDHFKNPQ